ncbi:MAG: hypothetical protein LBE98_04620 [Puniceicoccales bacterium]|jgi:hypothetical protein|nr:hypothetical protein [Puniceicoccales bacterium]
MVSSQEVFSSSEKYSPFVILSRMTAMWLVIGSERAVYCSWHRACCLALKLSGGSYGVSAVEIAQIQAWRGIREAKNEVRRKVRGHNVDKDFP